MSRPEIKRDSTRYLLIGYLMLSVLFAALWLLDTFQLDSQRILIDSTDMAAKKMRLSADLIEVARSRTRLSHEMVSEQDIFARDDIYQRIDSLAVEFTRLHQELEKLPLKESEKKILSDQSRLYPEVIDLLEELSQLGFEETAEANILARNLIIHEIVPRQEKVVDGFLKIMRDIQSNISASAQDSSVQHSSNVAYRYTLLVIIVIGSIVVLVWVVRLMSKIEVTLQTESLTDGLTGLSNRRCFDYMLTHIWQRSLRNEKSMSLLLIDIDYFKNYNDFYGHQEGDWCLKEVANIIKQVASRKSDVAARYGGEEFAIILSDTDVNGAQIVADKLLKKIHERKIPHLQSEVASFVTISIGIAAVKPSIDLNEEELPKAADGALYQSKETGRNRASIAPGLI
jgi:diguanylate cyclase (GGDEF)-like protein